MDNFKLISDSSNDQLQSNQLASGKQDYSRSELSSIAQAGNLPYKDPSASMLSEVADHFKTTFSNVAKGNASASEYLEVGALAVGAAVLGTFAAGRLTQRSAPLVTGRSESAASSLTSNSVALTEQTNALASNVIKLDRNFAGANGRVVNPNAASFTEQTNAVGSNVIKLERNSAGAKSAAVHKEANAVDQLDVEKRNALFDAFAEKAREHGVVQVNPSMLESQPVRNFTPGLMPPDKKIRWQPAEGSRNSIYEFGSKLTTDKELASFIPELAGVGDDLYINLRGSANVTDEAVKHFIKAKDAMRKIDLTGTSVTEHGAARLRMVLPNSEIIFDKSQALTPLERAIAKASLDARIRPWERASYQWVPPRHIAEVAFRQPH